jgi:hypothetical protein
VLVALEVERAVLVRRPHLAVKPVAAAPATGATWAVGND